MKRSLTLLIVALLVLPVPTINAQPAPEPAPYQIGFTSAEDVHTVDSNGNARTNLTNNPRPQSDPAFSLDGTRLAYTDDGRVMIANADGTNARRLNAEPLRQIQPAWSPDGTMMAVVTLFPNGDGARPVVQIYRVADGVRVGEITVPQHLVGEDTQPDWSPDGKTIAITRRAHNYTPPPPPITQPAVDRPARQGSTFSLEQVVSTPRIPPKPDVVLLIDISGSMEDELEGVKEQLRKIIGQVRAVQPETRFGVASYAGWENTGKVFTVHVPLTEDVGNGVDKIELIRNQESHEVWAHALIRTATDAFQFRPDSSRVVVVIGDEPSTEYEPEESDTIANAITALKRANVRFVGVDSGTDRYGLDSGGQATKIKEETKGALKQYVKNGEEEISKAILDGIKDLPVTVTPVPVCDNGLTLELTPNAPVEVPSGHPVKFAEKFTVSPNAVPGSTLRCTIEFRLNNETEPRPGHVQTVTVRVTDLVRPLVTVDDVTAQAGNGTSVPVEYRATATDSQGRSLTPVCTPASGTSFPIGVTTVTCTATDQQGNTGSDTAVITVVAANPKGTRIWLVTPDGATQTDLSARVGEPCVGTDDELPAWSPDGKQLAYSQDDRICVVAADGTGARRVAENGSPVIRPRHPAWLPDGSRIVFQAGDLELPPDLWTVAAQGGQPALLTRNASQPAIRRLPKISVTVTATPAEVPFNGATTIEAAVTNTGFAPAPATLTVTLPPGLQGNPIGGDLGPIAPGERKTATGQVTGVTAGEHVVTAAVGATSAQATVKVLERTGSLSLAVSAVPQPAFVGGDAVTVLFKLLNSSGSTMTDVRVVGSAFGCQPECAVGTIGPDGQAEVTFTIPATAAVDRELVGVVIATGPDENALDNVAATQIVIKQPTLTLDQQAGDLGGVVLVQGKDFPQGAKLRLTWTAGISETPGEVVATDGSFSAQMLVFDNDTEGIRQALAAPVEGPRFGEVKSPDFLALARTVQPADFVGRG
ncbi:VWA domain-containing protein [Lentzea sp. NPDC051213]|uniref:VWA domain-containing protein n=1 Tax=Lentzea sp. NPDC051213 TaxID=3364126 RepID=UPI0037B2C739